MNLTNRKIKIPNISNTAHLATNFYHQNNMHKL